MNVITPLKPNIQTVKIRGPFDLPPFQINQTCDPLYLVPQELEMHTRGATHTSQPIQILQTSTLFLFYLSDYSLPFPSPWFSTPDALAIEPCHEQEMCISADLTGFVSPATFSGFSYKNTIICWGQRAAKSLVLDTQVNSSLWLFQVKWDSGFLVSRVSSSIILQQSIPL